MPRAAARASVFHRRSLIAISAAFALSAGLVITTAAPASAAIGDPVAITSPVTGDVLTSRTVTVEGTGSDGATLAVGSADGTAPAVVTAVAAGGAWSAEITFSAAAPVDQTIQAAQLIDPDDATTLTQAEIDVTLPEPSAATPAGPIVLIEPTDGYVGTSRQVSVSGTAPAGSSLVLSVPGIDSLDLSVDGSGTFSSGLLILGFELGTSVTLTLTGTDAAGVALVPVSRTITLPAPIAAPVITSPANGSTVSRPNAGTIARFPFGEVTFSGTGIPGQSVSLFIRTTSVIPDGVGSDAGGYFPSTLVRADGTWSLQTTIAPDHYSVTATHIAAGGTTFDSPALSLPSEPIEFTLVISPQLADTGASTPVIALPAGGLVLLGFALVLLARRRRIAQLG